MAEHAHKSRHGSPDALVAEFLGEEAGIGGPFALLGVPHTFGGSAHLAAAVRRRLLQLDRHPMHLTPSADEVRLAIHTAAAQLSDPDLRAALASRWPPGNASSMPAAWRRKLDTVSPSLARRATMIVGASGGWNQRAKKRLAFLARVHRVTALELVRAVRPDSGTTAMSSVSVPGSMTLRLPDEPETSGTLWLVVHGVLTAMLLLLTGLALAELSRPEIKARPLAPIAERSVDHPGADTASRIPGPRDRIAHHAAMEQELRNTSLVATERPTDAVTRASRVIDSFLSGWIEMPADARERIARSLTEIAIAVTQASVSIQPWSERLGAAMQGEDPAAQMAAFGIAATLINEQSVSVRARDQLASLVSDPVRSNGGGFDAMMLDAAKRAATTEPTPGVGWWQTWGASVGACEGVSARERAGVLLDAMTRLLRNERPDSSTWRTIATDLAGRLDWRAGSRARRWLLDELTEPRASAVRLAVLTEVLATEVSVPGVDITMVLDENADMQARRDIAQRYRSAWVAMRAERSALQDRIAEGLSDALLASDGVVVFREQFMAVEALARLNAAAALDFESDPAAAGELLEPTAPGPARPIPASGGVLGEEWAQRLMNAEDGDAAASVLFEVRDAELRIPAAIALVDAAMRGAGKDARDRARLIIQARADSASVLLALEREVGDRPRRTLLALVDEILGSSFATSDEPADRIATRVRTALLARAAEKSGGVPQEAEYAHLGYADAVSARAGLTTGSAASEALAVLVERWRARGAASGEYSSDAVMPRLGGMAAVSGTQGQLEAAYHLALVQLMAGSLVERAGIDPRDISRVMLPLRIEWSNARSAIAQMLATQRAESRLWLLLLEGSP